VIVVITRLRCRPLLIGVCLVCVVLAGACSRPEPPPERGADPGLTPSPPAAAPVPTATPLPFPSPAFPGTYAGTPTPNPTPASLPNGTGVESYVVQTGETLTLIAAVFGCTVEEIAAANGLADANSISAGQTLYIPTAATETGPDLKLVPDSEMVYGPAYIHFDLPAFVAGRGGYLAGYTEQVEGRWLTGAEIIQAVSQRFSVGPRVLLALLELRAGWVTQPQPAAEMLTSPLSTMQAPAGLFEQLSWAALRLNEGYYGWKRGDRTTVRLAAGVRVAIAPGLNPGTAGVQNCLAGLSSTWDEWLALTGPAGFLAAYERLFGNPFAFTVDPLVPPGLVQPELWLPWESGHTWYFTGGPHGGWGDGSGWAALDFAPSDRALGCAPSTEWIAAAAPGYVVRSDNGEVIVDLDGDGFEQSGWVLLYLHVAAVAYGEARVAPGTLLQHGQPIGHPSCEGGLAEATHLHLARRYNGEWIPAGSGPAPLVLAGWTAHEDVRPYDGTLTRDDEVRTACECWNDPVNGLLSP